MSKRKKIKALAAAALIGSAAAAYVYLGSVTLDLTGYSGRFAALVESRWGFKAGMERVTMKALPSPDITISGLTVTGEGIERLRVGSMRIRLELLPLLYGRFVLTDFDVDGARLEAAAAGIYDIIIKQRHPLPVIKTLRIKAGGAIIRNEGRVMELSGVDAYLDKTKTGAAFRVNGTINPDAGFHATGVWDARSRKLEGALQTSGLGLGPVSRFLGRTEPAKGLASAAVSYSVEAASGGAAVNGVLSLRGVETRLPGILDKPLSADGDAKLALRLDDGVLDAAITGVSVKTAGITVTGTLHAKANMRPALFNDGEVSVAASTTPIPLSTLKGLVPVKLLPVYAADKITGVVPASGTITVEEASIKALIKDRRLDARTAPEGISLKVRLDRLAFRYPGLSEPVAGLSGRIAFKDMALALSDIEAQYGKGGITIRNLSGEVSGLVKRPSYAISATGVFDANELLRLANELGAPSFAPAISGVRAASGGVNLSLDLKGAVGASGSPDYAGTARLRGVVLSYAGTDTAIGPVDGAVSFDNGRITLKDVDAAFGASAFNLSGGVSDYTSTSPAFDINASGTLANETIREKLWKGAPVFDGGLRIKGRVYGNAGGFSAAAQLNTGGSAAGALRVFGAEASADGIRIRPGEPAEIDRLSLKAHSGSLWGHGFQNLAANLVLKKDAADVDASLHVDGGEASGRLTYYRRPDAPNVFDAEAAVNEVKLDEMFASFGTDKKILSGGISGKGRVWALRGRAQLIAGLNGTVELSAEKGRLYKFLLMSKIFSVVNIISIDELFKDGVPYKTLAGSFNIENGVISTEDLYFDSDSMRMSAVGTIDLNVPAIDSYLAIHPFVTIDKIVSFVPLAGWVMQGKDKSFVSLYYEISGPLGGPEVSPAPVKGLKEGIPGILERLISLPGEAVKDVQDILHAAPPEPDKKP
ncbi:MAG: AsmA-like C-terminal domain-containing protein [Deltaproteobacteria bacterium]|nr:AsmA-like C-terminal domain-containing protein [Deltaproteobacteria bacterium]